MVTGWAGDRRLRGDLAARPPTWSRPTRSCSPPAPASARAPPGGSPATGRTASTPPAQLQNLVHLHHAAVGRRAVVVGAELVSWSAVLTLREAGCRTVAMTGSYDHAESYAAFRAARPGRPADAGAHAHPRRRASTAATGSSRSRSRTSTPGARTHDRVRHGRLHRRLDPRPRAGPAGRARPRPGDAAARSSTPPCATSRAGGLRGRQPRAPGRHRRRRRPRRPARRGRRARPPGRSRAAGTRADSGSRRRRRCGGSPRSASLPGGDAPRGHLLLWTDRYQPAPGGPRGPGRPDLARRRVPWPAAPGRVFRVPADLVATPTRTVVRWSSGSSRIPG